MKPPIIVTPSGMPQQPDDELQKVLLAREVTRRMEMLDRLIKGMEMGHVFVEFVDAATVELALGGPGRRVDLGEPDAQGFYTPTIWVFSPDAKGG